MIITSFTALSLLPHVTSLNSIFALLDLVK